jgi:signal transduction histidine kinase
MQGDLSRRLQQRGVGDEFDQLADALNAMPARIEILMEGLKQVSNDIGYDLRTPLSRLRERLEALQRQNPSVAGHELVVDTSIRDARGDTRDLQCDSAHCRDRRDHADITFFRRGPLKSACDGPRSL